MIAERIEAEKREKERMRKAGFSEAAIEAVFKSRQQSKQEEE